MSEQGYWLFKSEPGSYSIDHLEADGRTPWDGVRNYQARNFMRDDCKLGDLVLYYHSNAKPPGVVGLAEVVEESHPDELQFDEDSKYYDPKATRDEPRWMLVDLGFKAKFGRTVSLAEMKDDETLDGMLVTQKGQRLSIQPVDKRHFDHVLELAGYSLDD